GYHTGGHRARLELARSEPANPGGAVRRVMHPPRSQMKFAMLAIRARTGASAEAPPSIVALARWPVLAITVGVGLVLLMTSGRVGYFDDELYFLAAGHHLDWGYADQGPLVPLLARLMDTVLPNSLSGERLPVTVLSATGVVVAALIARELGGRG